MTLELTRLKDRADPVVYQRAAALLASPHLAGQAFHATCDGNDIVVDFIDTAVECHVGQQDDDFFMVNHVVFHENSPAQVQTQYFSGATAAAMAIATLLT